MKYSCVPLGGLVTISGGGTPSRNNDAYWSGSIPWATVKDLKDTTLSDTQETITPEGLRDSASNLIPAGSVIVATRMGLGKVAINTMDVTINQDLKAFSCGADLEPRYLLYFLLANASHLDSMGKGATVKGITLDVLKDLSVPLPPLTEQKRIAAILDKADSIRRRRQVAVRLIEELLRSTFLDMFGDPVENAKKWHLMPIGLAIKAIETGWSANSEDRPREKDEWAVLKISSVTSGRFIPDEYKVVAEGQIDRELLTPKRGDLLFSRANTRELVAATCLVEQDEPKLFLPDKLWKIIPDEEITCSAYLRYLLAHPRFREKLTKQATGTSGSMLNISQAKVRGIEMPVPPIKLQKQFADFVWRNYNIRNKLEAASQSSNTLFNSLLQRAFKGEL
jgi:type I restriction enzyme S subunit